MSGKSIEHWRSAWDNAQSDSPVGGDAGKTLNLLSQYSAFFKRDPILAIVGGSAWGRAWGGAIGRFFSGRWRTHHGDDVQSAIANYYSSGYSDYDGRVEKIDTVEYILARVKQAIGDKPMNPSGDLFRILKVVEEKTGVSYTSLDCQSILNNIQGSTATIMSVVSDFPPPTNSSNTSSSILTTVEESLKDDLKTLYFIVFQGGAAAGWGNQIPTRLASIREIRRKNPNEFKIALDNIINNEPDYSKLMKHYPQWQNNLTVTNQCIDADEGPLITWSRRG